MNAMQYLRNPRTILVFVLGAVVLDLVLIQPNHPAAVSWRSLRLFPLELPAILLALIAFGRGRISLTFRTIIVTVLSAIAVLKAADFTMFSALNRGFNLIADFPLVKSFYDLIVGTLGQNLALLAIVVSILIIIGLVYSLWWACRVWSNYAWTRNTRRFATIGALLFTCLSVADIGAKMGAWKTPFTYPGTAFTARVGVERVVTARKTLADLRLFQEAARNDPFSEETDLFDLVDRDILIVFVESYGRTSLDTPLYADLHRETLATAQETLAEQGLAMSSSLLTSPTKGGQSWLAHSTFANGLWIANQTSYRAALSSGRKTLFHLAEQSGFHTAAVMPQITLDWPEAQFMGFDTILAADDLGYEGEPFNWITMPDQFTFAAMDRLLRINRPDDQPQFVQIALGSSHAPWVPVPDLIAWEDLGNGTIFNPIVAGSDTPREVWQDNDRVRAQYRLAVDYALQTVFAYAALHAEDPPLMIIIGDHQAAGFVALDERPHVPIHLVGPKNLVDLIADGDFSSGLIPSEDTNIRSMDQMRSHLLRSLSSNDVSTASQ